MCFADSMNIDWHCVCVSVIITTIRQITHTLTNTNQLSNEEIEKSTLSSIFLFHFNMGRERMEGPRSEAGRLVSFQYSFYILIIQEYFVAHIL